MAWTMRGRVLLESRRGYWNSASERSNIVAHDQHMAPPVRPCHTVSLLLQKTQVPSVVPSSFARACRPSLRQPRQMTTLRLMQADPPLPLTAVLQKEQIRSPLGIAVDDTAQRH